MAWEVTFTLRDAFSRTTTKKLTNTQTLLADAITDTATMLGYLEALSDCAVVKTSIAQITTYSTSPAAGANVDAGATIHARLNNGKLAPVKVPGVDLDIINADGSVDLTDGAVTNLETALGSGGTWTISEGNTVSNFESGELDR